VAGDVTPLRPGERLVSDFAALSRRVQESGLMSRRHGYC